ncbi:hypothetical protein C8Q74DRAFT_1195234 [Fomes fomentarius]|nr:hypothetical protein C8Q74DRAFT_1195234 [Fomes fomentarius]
MLGVLVSRRGGRLAAHSLTETVSFSALTCYEYIITLAGEIEYFWGSSLTGSTAIFFVNRYLYLSYRCLSTDCILVIDCVHDSCMQYASAAHATEILCYVPRAIFSALRVFALSGRNRFLTYAVLILSLAPVALDFAGFRWATYTIVPFSGCENIDLTFCTVNVFSRVSLIVSDILVIAVTWCATFKTSRIARGRGRDGHHTLSALLLRDGDVLLTMNTLQLVFTTSSVGYLVTKTNTGYIIQLFEPLSVFLVGRFLLSIQQTNARMCGLGIQSETTMVSGGATDSLRFDRLVGSMGDSLVFSPLSSSLSLEDMTSGEYSERFASMQDDEQIAGIDHQRHSV